MTTERTRTDALLHAAVIADWIQVAQNGGPPCFHLEGNRFCLRAERWQGHGLPEPGHAFVSLADLLAALASRQGAAPTPPHNEACATLDGDACNCKRPAPARASVEGLVARLDELLTCNHDAPHYCANCGKSRWNDVRELFKELAALSTPPAEPPRPSAALLNEFAGFIDGFNGPVAHQSVLRQVEVYLRNAAAPTPPSPWTYDRKTLEAAVLAVDAERLHDPTDEEGDKAYQRAVEDCTNALREMLKRDAAPTPETPGGPR